MFRYLLALMLLGCVGGRAQAACDASVYRQFDFWLGDWQVYKPDGKLAGENHIQRRMNNCVVHERYQAPTGYVGESFSIYDARTQQWHQTWVDSDGLLLTMSGGLQGNQMVLEGDGVDATGKPARQRVTWTPNTDATIRQLWQSRVAGESWQTVFDGRYRKQEAVPAKQTGR